MDQSPVSTLTVPLKDPSPTVPANTPQSVELPEKEAKNFWMDSLSILYKTSFPRASRDAARLGRDAQVVHLLGFHRDQLRETIVGECGTFKDE